MKNIRTIIHHLLREENGQDLIEYALVAALIGLAAVAALNALSTDLTGIFNNIGTSLSSAII